MTTNRSRSSRPFVSSHAPELQDGGVVKAGVQAAGHTEQPCIGSRCVVLALARAHPLDEGRLAYAAVPCLGDRRVGRLELLQHLVGTAPGYPLALSPFCHNMTLVYPQCQSRG